MEERGEIKSRSIRLDDVNWKWFSELPGRTSNDAVSALRDGGRVAPAFDGIDALSEILDLVRGIPDEVAIEEIVLRAIDKWKSQKATSSVNSSTLAAPIGFPIHCQHCGNDGRGSTKFATICFDCKREKHVAPISDCPPCSERGTGAL